MKRILRCTVFVFWMLVFGLLLVSEVRAIEDPVSLPNNKVGVHVLHPEEVEAAARLVNNEGKAEWGYITVPISAADRNRERWISFMKRAKELKVIPIVRVATVPIGSDWIAADNFDLVDFANFLNDLPWPVKNRYVIIFNEVNRSSEWGGKVEPEEYAQILSNAIEIFKERNEDFFVLAAGLDNAAPDGGEFVQYKKYLERMNREVPGIFGRVDGWNSHAYPNPAFAGKPWDKSDRSVYSYAKDLEFIARFTDKKLPVFITETGWDMHKVGGDQAAYNYKYAFENVWNDPRIVAVTPFLLMAGDGPFVPFSLVDRAGPTMAYKEIQSFATKGSPTLVQTSVELDPLPQVAAGVQEIRQVGDNVLMKIDAFFADLLGLITGSTGSEYEKKKIKVADRVWEVELADNAYKRQKGLSGRDKLEVGKGMLFVFSSPGNYVFWMRDMKFDIDIVYIYDDRVVEVRKAEHETPYVLFRPEKRANMVLEVPVNSGIKVGDKFEY